MDFISNNPFDDIKKLEYFRFMQIEKNCRQRWERTEERLERIQYEHSRCAEKRSKLEAHLENTSRMLEREICERREIEAERDYYERKLKRTYELLRYDRDVDDLQMEKQNVGKSNDEIASTGSFLSNFCDISDTPAEDDYNEVDCMVQNLSEEFNELFEAEYARAERKAATLQQFNQSLLDETIRNAQLILKDDVDLDDSRMTNDNSPRYAKIMPRKQKFVQPMEALESNPSDTFQVETSPIYERIKGDSNKVMADENNIEYIEKVTIKHVGEANPKHVEIINSQNVKQAIININSAVHISPKCDMLINPHSCQHNLVHRGSLTSVDCFFCSKKIRAIIVMKCTICKVFIHPECKSLLKGKKYNISEYAPTHGLNVPPLIVHCVNEIETRGLTDRGIYRVSGSDKEVKALIERFFQGDCMPNLAKIDIHVICSCLKSFLRTLSEPLIPTPLWAVFSNTVVGFDSDYINSNILKKLEYLIDNLPKANRETLAFIVLHLQRVSSCPDVHMPIPNLAKIFGPTIIGYSRPEPQYATILDETIIQTTIMTHFLNIPMDYWFHFICSGFK